MRNGRRLAMLLSALLACSCGRAEQVVGRADVIDGDGLQLGELTVRLFGIDAPEGQQSCRREGRAWACGEASARKLRELVNGRVVTCEPRDVDSYGRIVAVCRTGGIDVNAALVESGLALAYRRFSDDYVPAEETARRRRAGMWAGEFEPPWEWRQRRQDQAGNPAAGQRGAACDIKGNISRNGNRIYHVPGSPSYQTTVVDSGRGERWFCSEREARDAGWRAPRR
ncbi:MAG: thermonuclease family protein [Gammaproteobacteria bacterium]|nr:thermonuclease family protein [Gammaproteobacteria bacterium]